MASEIKTDETDKVDLDAQLEEGIGINIQWIGLVEKYKGRWTYNLAAGYKRIIASSPRQGIDLALKLINEVIVQFPTSIETRNIMLQELVKTLSEVKIVPREETRGVEQS